MFSYTDDYPIEPMNSDFIWYIDLHIPKMPGQWGQKRQFLGGPFMDNLLLVVNVLDEGPATNSSIITILPSALVPKKGLLYRK